MSFLAVNKIVSIVSLRWNYLAKQKYECFVALENRCKYDNLAKLASSWNQNLIQFFYSSLKINFSCSEVISIVQLANIHWQIQDNCKPTENRSLNQMLHENSHLTSKSFKNVPENIREKYFHRSIDQNKM